jgi:hypothetical protein
MQGKREKRAVSQHDREDTRRWADDEKNKKDAPSGASFFWRRRRDSNAP